MNTVALVEALPARSLKCGQVGAVVEQLAPDIFEAKFADAHGTTYQMLSLRAEQILVLRCGGAATP